jgi:hypothetical protein
MAKKTPEELNEVSGLLAGAKRFAKRAASSAGAALGNPESEGKLAVQDAAKKLTDMFRRHVGSVKAGGGSVDLSYANFMHFLRQANHYVPDELAQSQIIEFLGGTDGDSSPEDNGDDDGGEQQPEPQAANPQSQNDEKTNHNGWYRIQKMKAANAAASKYNANPNDPDIGPLVNQVAKAAKITPEQAMQFIAWRVSKAQAKRKPAAESFENIASMVFENEIRFQKAAMRLLEDPESDAMSQQAAEAPGPGGEPAPPTDTQRTSGKTNSSAQRRQTSASRWVKEIEPRLPGLTTKMNRLQFDKLVSIIASDFVRRGLFHYAGDEQNAAASEQAPSKNQTASGTSLDIQKFNAVLHDAGITKDQLAYMRKQAVAAQDIESAAGTINDQHERDIAAKITAALLRTLKTSQ